MVRAFFTASALTLSFNQFLPTAFQFLSASALYPIKGTIVRINPWGIRETVFTLLACREQQARTQVIWARN